MPDMAVRFQVVLGEEDAAWVDLYAEKIATNRSQVIRLAVRKLRDSAGGSGGPGSSSRTLGGRKGRDTLPSPDERLAKMNRDLQAARSTRTKATDPTESPSPSSAAPSPLSASSTSESSDSLLTSQKSKSDSASSAPSSSSQPASTQTASSTYPRTPEDCPHAGIVRSRDGECRACGKVIR